MNKKVFKIVKWTFGLGILLALIVLVDWRALLEAFRMITVSSILYLLALSAALIIVSAIKWKFFLTHLTSRSANADGAQTPTVTRLCALYLVGYFINTFVPSFVGGDAVRSYYVGKRTGQHAAAAATILERYTGLLAMVILAFIFMWFSALVTIQIQIVVSLIAAGLAGVTVVALSPKLLAVSAKIPGVVKILPHLQKIQSALNLARKDSRLMFGALALSFVFHSLTVVNTMVAGMAVGWFDPPAWDLFVVVPLILLLGAVPLAPSGLGIQEGAFFFFLTGVGATPAQALGVALLLRAKGYFLALVGAVLWILVRKDKALIPEVASVS